MKTELMFAIWFGIMICIHGSASSDGFSAQEMNTFNNLENSNAKSEYNILPAFSEIAV